MQHEIKEDHGVTIVSFHGDVDLQSSPAARRILLECVGKKHPVLVDLSDATYIDSSGIASLVESLQKARQAGSEFALVSVSDAARKVLQLGRLDKVFTIYDTIEEGLAHTR